MLRGRSVLVVTFLSLAVATVACSKSRGGGGDGGLGGGGGSGGGTGGGDGYDGPENCGDDVVDEDEECDDGNRASGDGCDSHCRWEPGWDCFDDECIPSACGDGYRVRPEQCDDGNRTSGDGCSIRCTIEPGWVCITPNFPCRRAVCGDGAVEAQEQCDDGNTAPDDGCDANCQLETGYHCPTPGAACVATVCGDSLVQGLEQCDDGNDEPLDGCDADCQLEPGYHCPTPGAACVATECGDSLRQGLEECDDGNTEPDDGCSPTCEIEPFYECAGSPLSVCDKPIEFVRIAKFPAPMQQPQAVHYDPRTRSFVAYGFNVAQGVQEVCLDGTPTDIREAHLIARRALVGNSLDGAAYDVFHDTFLFVRQNGTLYEINRDNEEVQSVSLNGVGTAGGVQVGDDQRIYVANHFAQPADAPAPPPNTRMIRVFERNAAGTIPTAHIADRTIRVTTDANYLDNLFVIPGLNWIGYYIDIPDGTAGNRQFGFHRYDQPGSPLVGYSDVPGILFRNGERFPANADGGEAAVDGGYFLVCSEYLDHEGNGGVPGFCQLFAQTCATHLDCARRVPGTICKLDEEIPYCYSPAIARDDRYVVALDASATTLDVLVNDSFADAVCTGDAATITEVTAGSHGGTITITEGGATIDYTPAAGQCGFVETFVYTANLGGSITDTATVFVTVSCECGNNVVDPGEQCDDGNTTPGDGCSETCQWEATCGNGVVEPGEQCDDGNTVPGDGCSPTCTFELSPL